MAKRKHTKGASRTANSQKPVLQEMRDPSTNKIEPSSQPVARDEAQVKRDVNRTTLSEKGKQELVDRICQVLVKYPQLHYYQGFHEIGQQCDSAEELEVLALTTLRDFMTKDMTPTLQVLDLIVPLMCKADYQLGQIVSRVPSHFAVAPIITLFAHTFDRSSKASRRIIERVQAHGLSHILYLYVALCLRARQQLIQTSRDNGNDWSLLHAQLAKMHLVIGSYSERELAELSLEALGLAKKHPLHKLRPILAISPHSSLKCECNLADAAEHAKNWPSTPPETTKRTSNRTVQFAVAVALVVVGFALQKQR